MTIFDGIQGELGVCKALESISQFVYLKYIHNFPLMTKNTGRQIDCVVLSTKGFYCVEVKNWRCELEVDNLARYWRTHYGDTVINVPSPLIQNKRHLKTLSDLSHYKFENLVVFSNETRLINPLDNTVNVSYLEDFFINKKTIFTPETVNIVYERLKSIKQRDEVTLIADFLLKRGFGCEV